MIRRAGTILLLTAALAAAAGDPVAAIVDQARGSPVETFADVVFHLIDTNQIPEKDRVALLDEIFLRAGSARQSMTQGFATIPMAPSPNPAQILATTPSAHGSSEPPVVLPVQMHLDALNIRCRIVKAMMAIDGKHARELFNQISPPDVPKADCQSAVVYDPTVYFDTLAAVVTKTPFTAKELEKQIPFWTMEGAVRGVHTSVEIIAAARNFSPLVHTQQEALSMSGAFAAALRIDDSDRNFGAAIRSNLVDAVLVAANRFASLGTQPQTMQAALRAYLVRHLTAARCADNVDGLTDDALAAFNIAVKGQAAVPPITADESKALKLEGTAETQKPFDHSESDDLLKAIATDTKKPDRPGKDDLIKQILAWQGADGQSPLQVFRRRVAMLAQLEGTNVLFLDSRGPGSAIGPPHDPAIMAAIITTLSDPAVLELSPSDWLTEVGKVDQRFVTHDSPRGKGYFETPPNNAIQMLVSSSLSALQVYGKLAEFEQSLGFRGLGGH